MAPCAPFAGCHSGVNCLNRRRWRGFAAALVQPPPGPPFRANRQSRHDDRRLQPLHAQGVSRSPGRPHSRPSGADRVPAAQDAVGRRCAPRAARRVRRHAARAVAGQSAARADRPAGQDAGAGADGQRRACRDLPQASRSFPDLHRLAADEQCRGLGEGGRPRGEGARRARRPGVHQRRRRAAVGAEIPAGVPAHGGARSRRLGASDAHRAVLRLRQREGIAERNLVQLRLALRDHRLHDAADLFGDFRRAAGAEDRQPPHGRHDPVFLRQD